MEATSSVDAFPVIELSSGLRVANFSSPHPFTFETGEVLAACSKEQMERGALRQVEQLSPCPCFEGAEDVRLQIEMSDECRAGLEDAERRAAAGEFHIVLVPFMLRDAICKDRGLADLSSTPFRVIRTVDRQTKAISASRFCV